MTELVVVYHSASGRTRALAEAVVRGALAAADGGVVARLVSVEEAPLAQAALAAADAIVFGCPTYMGSVSAQFKAFMDATSTVWALQGWRDKLAAGFTHSAAPSGDKLGTLTQLAVFAAQHGMVWIGLGLPPTYAGADSPHDDLNRLGSHLGAMAQSRPGGGVLPIGDVKTAEHLGRRVADAAQRWRRGARPLALAEASAARRHVAARSWTYPASDRARSLGGGVDRINLREMVAEPSRFEHHLTVCATVDDVQLEITTASEPLYFSHINVSDEYALALPTGDELIDRFPLRTFLSDAATGVDVGRYNHRIGDLVLHPQGLLHWPGRLRSPYDPFDFPPGMRRCGLSLVYCASKPTPATSSPLPRPPGRDEDAKAYVTPAPAMVLASMRGAPGELAHIGRTTLELLELPDVIAPAHGGWVVVLESQAESEHAACDLLRIPDGGSLDGHGIVRALLLRSSAQGPDPIPPSWAEVAAPPFVPFEEGEPGALPVELTSGAEGAAGSLRIEEISPSLVAITLGETRAEVPRYWLARMLFRLALHGLRLGYAETYGGFFSDDRGETELVLGLRGGGTLALPREGAMREVERLYRAVAPVGYRERLD